MIKSKYQICFFEFLLLFHFISSSTKLSLPPNINEILYNVMDMILEKEHHQYQEENMSQKWIDQICDRMMETLIQLQKPFKYIGAL